MTIDPETSDRAPAHDLSPRRADALREVANIGAGHAATALSSMTGTRIMIDVPTINVAQAREILPLVMAGGNRAVVVAMTISGGLGGRTAIAFPYGDATMLAALFLRRAAPEDESLSELARSALREAGNILVGAYLTALSDVLGMVLMPSPPTLEIVPASEPDRLGLAADPGDDVLFVETIFTLDNAAAPLRGFFFLVPDEGSLETIFRAVRVA